MPLLNAEVSQVQIYFPRLRWPIPAELPERLRHATITGLSRRAKYILVSFSLQQQLIGHVLLHLGMSGRLCLLAQDEPRGKHDHIEWRFADGRILRLRDPRRFGAVLWLEATTPIQQHILLAKLGPEPLEPEFDAEYLYRATRNKSSAIKTSLMDSHLVVGVGNIYASESLFRAGISPTRAAGKLSQRMCQELVAQIKATLTEAIQAGGSSLRDFYGADGNPGYFQQHYFVYGRTGLPCERCQHSIRQIKQGQRSTFFCPQCQKR